MNFVFTLPRDTKLRSEIKEKFSELVTPNSDSTKLEISSHWQKYLPGVKVYLYPKDGLPRKAFIEQQGLAGLEKIRLRSLIYNTLVIIKNNYLMIKFSVNFLIFLKIIKISIKTTRLLNFDMIKHAILISKTKKYLDMSYFSNFVVIGDGFGFLGTLLKEVFPQIKNITFVNLPKNLFLDFLFFTKLFSSIDAYPKLISAHKFNGFDEQNTLFFNVASLSEMTVNQIHSYLNSIKNVGGTLISLNRNSKTHPDGSRINLEDLLKKYERTLIFEENPCQFYSQYPTGGLAPLFLPFDGPVHFKIIKL